MSDQLGWMCVSDDGGAFTLGMMACTLGRRAENRRAIEGQRDGRIVRRRPVCLERGNIDRDVPGRWW